MVLSGTTDKKAGNFPAFKKSVQRLTRNSNTFHIRHITA